MAHKIDYSAEYLIHPERDPSSPHVVEYPFEAENDEQAKGIARHYKPVEAEEFPHPVINLIGLYSWNGTRKSIPLEELSDFP
jgi:hypothetical protein